MSGARPRLCSRAHSLAPPLAPLASLPSVPGYAADGYARAKGVGCCVATFTVGKLEAGGQPLQTSCLRAPHCRLGRRAGLLGLMPAPPYNPLQAACR